MTLSTATRQAPTRPATRLYGSETPRVWTPPLRELTGRLDDDGRPVEPVTTLGYYAIWFAENVLEIELYPWQKWLLVHALEVLDDGVSFRFRNIVVLVARQNGKSTLSQVLSLFGLYYLGIRLILGTAQDLDTAEEVWDGALELIESTPELAERALDPIRVNGKKTIRLKTGERYKVKAAGRRAGRGLSGDLILLDELREHQTWDAWGAITKTAMARPNAQIWALSNAGDAASVVLRYLRMMAHATLGDPDGINAIDDPSLLLGSDDDADPDDLAVEPDDTLGIFEWSAPPGCEVSDRSGWAQANPSLGWAITERTIASASRTDPEWVFRTEVLCQWSDGSLEGPFPAGSWDAGIDRSSTIDAGSPLAFCVDVSWDRTKAHIGVAGRRPDGQPHVEVIASRAGTDWVVDWFTSPLHPHRAEHRIAVQPSGPAGTLVEPLTDASSTFVVQDVPLQYWLSLFRCRRTRTLLTPAASVDVPLALVIAP